MNRPEPTRQQLDPAGTHGAFGPSVALAIMSVGWATLLTLVDGIRPSSAPASVLALALIGLAAALLVSAAAPLRAPFTGRAHAMVQVVALLAFLASSWAKWGVDESVLRDWAPISIGLLIVALSPYRPAWELVVAGTGSAVVIALVTVARIERFDTDAPLFAFVGTEIIPLLALSYGSATYTRVVVESLERWQQRAEVASEALAEALREGITRSVREDRVTILKRDVAPFFGDIVASGVITTADRKRAREIAEAIRSVMVAEVDRSWLDSTLALTAQSTLATLTVDDAESLAARMNTRQSTAVLALIEALAENPEIGPVSMRLATEDGTPTVVLSTVVALSAADFHAEFDPYLAVLRVVFTDFTTENFPPDLIVRFRYDRD